MFNTLKNKVSSYFFSSHVKKSYNEVYTLNTLEEVYYKDSKLIIAIKDEDVGQQIFPIVKILKDKGETICSLGTVLKIDKYIIDKENRVKFLYIDFSFSEDWKSLSQTQKLYEMVDFIYGMQSKGYVLDVSKFDKEKCNAISAFLSCFIPDDTQDDERENTIQGCLIEYIHYVLSNGTDFEGFYTRVLDKVICNADDFPYHLPIIKMCYNYFTSGIIPNNIGEIPAILQKEITIEGYSRFDICDNFVLRSFSEYSNLKDEITREFCWDLIVNQNILESSFNVSEENDEYKIYCGNIKIYHNISPELELFLKDNNKVIKSNSSQIIEKITELIIDFDGNIIGYKFRNENISNCDMVSEADFKTQSEIFDFMIIIINFIKEIKNLYSSQGRVENNFDFEKSLIYVNGGFKIPSFKDVFNLVSYDENMLKVQITTMFFKLYLKYIDGKYGKLYDEEQFFDKIEVRYLDPILAREFINYALNGTVDYDLAIDAFLNFLFTTKTSTENGYIYDSRFAYNPLETAGIFDYEAEKKYGIQINREMKEVLPDGRILVTFKRRKRCLDVKNMEESAHIEIIKRLGSISDEHVKIVGISEIIYSKELNSDHMYKVAGYITSPIKGNALTDELLLGLSNKDFLKVSGYLFTKFYNYYINLESILMDDNFVFYINIFDENFWIMKYPNNLSTSFVFWIYTHLLNIGGNPNTFVNINIVTGYSDFKEYALSLADRLNVYCDEHGIYYDSKYNMCPICHKTKYFVADNFEKDAVLLFEDMYAKHYKIDDEYNLKIYKSSFSDIAEIEKNIDQIIIKNLDSEEFNLHQECFVPYKKAINGNNKFIGYIYKSVEFDSDLCIDIASSEKMKNLPRLKSLIRLILQVNEITEENLGFMNNPFSHVFLSKCHKKQVQILNVEFLSQNASLEDTIKWTCEYVCRILASDESIEIDVSDCGTNLEALLDKLTSVSEEMTKYCSFHNMYYSNKYLFCPKCFDKKQMERIVIEEVDLSKITNNKQIGEGGESIVYAYGDSVAKIFRDGEVDYNFKSMIIVRILSKKDVLDEINNQGNSYQYIYPEKILVDSNSHNMCGYTMEKIDGVSIRELRFKDRVEKLGFTVKDVLEILITVGKGIETLHTKANIYIGDLNGGNILVDSQKNVYFLDFDGMGIDDIAPTFFTEGYIDPVSKKNQNITRKDDWYSFAIQAFNYLTFIHPFKGRYPKNEKMDIEDRMENKISLLGNHGIPIPPIARQWDWMTKELKKAFLDIFEFDSRRSIVPELEMQYKNLISTNTDPTLVKLVRINPKFVAKEINFASKDIVRIINPYSAICRNKDEYFLVIRINSDIQEFHFSESINIKNVLLSEDGRIAFCVYENRISVVDLNANSEIHTIQDVDTKNIVLDNNTLYFSGNSDGSNVIFETKFSYDEENGCISNFTVKDDEIKFLPKQETKKFLVKFNSKFVIVKKSVNGEDEIYCNTQKLCNVKCSSEKTGYNIIYDEITKWWFIINTDGYAVIIKSNGKYQNFQINQIINDDNIGNIIFNKGKIFVPCQDTLYIISLGEQNKSDQIVKKMECNNIMTPNSKIYNINTYGYSVVTDNMLYEVRRG